MLEKKFILWKEFGQLLIGRSILFFIGIGLRYSLRSRTARVVFIECVLCVSFSKKGNQFTKYPLFVRAVKSQTLVNRNYLCGPNYFMQLYEY